MLKKHIISILCVIVCFISLIVLVGVYIRQDRWENSLTVLISELSNNQSSVSQSGIALDSYATEISQLKLDLAAAQKYAEDWKSYAENISAQVISAPEYHEQTTIKEVEVEKPVYVNNEWREFESPAVLMGWAKEHLAYLWVVGNQIADCDDYASRLQLEAFKDGYLLSVQLIKDGKLDGKNVSNYTELHMGNLAMIGNEIYFVEPQPDYFRIVYVCDRD